jgi:nicotinamidase-related amidase
MGQLEGPIAPVAVHLCVDMQILFSERGLWPTPWMQRVLPAVVRLVERAPDRTVFTRFITPADAREMPGCWRAYYQKWPQALRAQLGGSQLQLVPALRDFTPPAVVLDKMVYSAFATGQLPALLSERNVGTLVVTGSETDVCVLSSVLDAVDFGYRVIIARDAICSSSDRTHDFLLNLYETRFDVQIEVATVDEIIAAWQPHGTGKA